MKLQLWQKNVLSMLVIIIIGYVLFNMAFILAAGVMNIVNRIIGVESGSSNVTWLIYLSIIILISWLVFRSHLNDLAKAAYLTMPLMVALILDGILLNHKPQWVILLVGGAIVGAVLLYLIRMKRSWFYYFAIAYVVALALIVMFAGIEI